MKKILTGVSLVRRTSKVKKIENVENVENIKDNVIQTKKTMEELYLEREAEKLNKVSEPKFRYDENSETFSLDEKWLAENEEKYHRRSSFKDEEEIFKRVGTFSGVKPYKKIVKLFSC